jgi:hypothetical protein
MAAFIFSQYPYSLLEQDQEWIECCTNRQFYPCAFEWETETSFKKHMNCKSIFLVFDVTVPVIVWHVEAMVLSQSTLAHPAPWSIVEQPPAHNIQKTASVFPPAAAPRSWTSQSTSQSSCWSATWSSIPQFQSLSILHLSKRFGQHWNIWPAPGQEKASYFNATAEEVYLETYLQTEEGPCVPNRVVYPCHSSKTSSTHDTRHPTRDAHISWKAWFGQDTGLDNRFSAWYLIRRESKSFVGSTELLQVASGDMIAC